MKKEMTKQECHVVQDLLLLKAKGRELAADESELVRRHAARCPDCREEARLFDLLAFRSDGDSPLDPADERRKSELLNAAVIAYMSGDRREPARVPASASRPMWVLAAAAGAAVLLVAAAYLLFFHDAGREGMGTDQGLFVTRIAGKASVGTASLNKGAAVGSGDRLTLGAGAFAALSDLGSCRVFFLEGTEVVVGEQGEGLREFELVAGTLVAETGGGPAACSLAVRAGDAMVRNVGTLFSVERSAEERIVRVVSGKVVVTTATGREWKVHAGEKLFIGSGSTEEGRLTEREATAIREAAAGRLSPAAADEKKEDLITPPPESPVEKSLPDVEGAEGAQAASKKANKAGQAAMDAAGLLKKARMLRKDKDWDGAEKIYMEIMDGHPGSGEAGIAGISLGEIFLEHKGNPVKALKYFNAYRAANPGGSLFKEASYGAIRCYRKMGQADKESVEIEKFLKQFPDDLYSKKLKQRLEDLQKEKPE
jgi:tetratricopeptide (TPR) repeat protein